MVGRQAAAGRGAAGDHVLTGCSQGGSGRACCTAVRAEAMSTALHCLRVWQSCPTLLNDQRIAGRPADEMRSCGGSVARSCWSRVPAERRVSGRGARCRCAPLAAPEASLAWCSAAPGSRRGSPRVSSGPQHRRAKNTRYRRVSADCRVRWPGSIVVGQGAILLELVARGRGCVGHLRLSIGDVGGVQLLPHPVNAFFVTGAESRLAD